MELGLGEHWLIDEYTDFSAFLLVKAGARETAAALGRAEEATKDLGDQSLGLVLEAEESDWSWVFLEEDHAGIPVAFTLGDDEFRVPFEGWFGDQFQGALKFRIPEAPLRRSTPLTAAARAGAALKCEALAVFAFECNDCCLVFLDQGQVEWSLHRREGKVTRLDGNGEQALEESFPEAADRVMKELKAGLLQDYWPRPQTLEGMTTWQIGMTADQLNSERWAEIAEMFG